MVETEAHMADLVPARGATDEAAAPPLRKAVAVDIRPEAIVLLRAAWANRRPTITRRAGATPANTVS